MAPKQAQPEPQKKGPPHMAPAPTNTHKHLTRHHSIPFARGKPNLVQQDRSSSLASSPSIPDGTQATGGHFNGTHGYQAQDLVHSSHKSAASLCASDSAFSQSQSTLRSEPQHLSSSRDSLKAKDQFIKLDPDRDQDSAERQQQRKSKSFSEPHKSPDDESKNPSLAKNDQNEHFEIIWRNLSYQIPEKKFAQVTAYLKRSKKNLWPTDDAQHDYEHQDHSPEYLCNSNDEKPPMRSPTCGKPRRVIFKNLNGCMKSGQLTAILGPSGAGKTTFLRCLTNSIVKGVSGTIDIRGGGSSKNLKLCIIPQKDYLFDNLTVMENLIFASRIKNIEANFAHVQNVERVAFLLGLQSCLKLKTSKLSGGQYKRVSIAQELLSKPDILILDEPTSGLDSLTCFKTVSVLRDLVDMSHSGLIPPLAIVMTIHQPQIKIFNQFHHLYILSSMGQCVYEGRPGNLVETVANCCRLSPPQDDLDPASFIIDLASEVYGSEPIDKLTNFQRNMILNQYSTPEDHNDIVDDNDSRICSANDDKLNNKMGKLESYASKNLKKKKSGANLDLDEESGAKANDSSLDNPKLNISERLIRRNNHKGSFWLHTSLLTKRLWTSMWRDPLLATTRITFHFIVPFVFYFIYSQKSGMANACPYVEREIDFQSMASDANINRLKDQHNELILSFENVSLFFLLLYSFSMCVLAVTALSFPLNMQILLKETSNGWYSMPRFVMAKTLADLPMELSMPMISVAIAYVLTGQPSSYYCWRMLAVTTVMTLCSLISQTQGLLFGAYFMNNVQAAVFVSQASSLPWIMLSGFTTRISELPRILQWLSFGSIYRLGIESIVSVRYGFGMCPCDQEIVNGTPTKLVGIPDQLRSVMSYYLEVYNTDAPSNSSVDLFEKIASTLSKANTYGAEVISCHDVRPFILSAREVDEGTLPTFILILVLIFVGLKVLLFGVVKFRAI